MWRYAQISFETSAVWSNLMPLYDAVTHTLKQALLRETGFTGYVGSHISHLYGPGACLYYTIGVRTSEGSTPPQMIEQYTGIKRAATDEIMKMGGALSHHHAVGREHQPWIERELSATGIQSIRGMKASLDPKGILNPGTLIPAAGNGRHRHGGF